MVNKPEIILSHPQMHENIGATARSMANFSLETLRLIAPRDGKPEEKAFAMASGADKILENAQIYNNFQDGIADIEFMIATTARLRDMSKPMMTPEQVMPIVQEKLSQGMKCAFLFGCERTGLENEEIVYADILVRVPVVAEFASLNLAQSVLLLGYEWYKYAQADNLLPIKQVISPPASKKDLLYLFEHLEAELDRKNFLRPIEKRPNMVQTLRNILVKADLNEQEVRTLRGVIRALSSETV